MADRRRTIDEALRRLEISISEEAACHDPIAEQLETPLLAQLQHAIGPQGPPVQHRELDLQAMPLKHISQDGVASPALLLRKRNIHQKVSHSVPELGGPR
jgi:hypothetical protein